ncbi:hypothetical protein DIPPA_14418 [Diplonema papillatum]|nr:hypothetical protein DIPPA_14418 [Diplonema papillatum]KAJ9472098.1 hypothetical protein DIPPA_14418 [Diplonema papillatum]
MAPHTQVAPQMEAPSQPKRPTSITLQDDDAVLRRTHEVLTDMFCAMAEGWYSMWCDKNTTEDVVYVLEDNTAVAEARGKAAMKAYYNELLTPNGPWGEDATVTWTDMELYNQDGLVTCYVNEVVTSPGSLKAAKRCFFLQLMPDSLYSKIGQRVLPGADLTRFRVCLASAAASVAAKTGEPARNDQPAAAAQLTDEQKESQMMKEVMPGDSYAGSHSRQQTLDWIGTALTSLIGAMNDGHFASWVNHRMSDDVALEIQDSQAANGVHTCHGKQAVCTFYNGLVERVWGNGASISWEDMKYQLSAGKGVCSVRERTGASTKTAKTANTHVYGFLLNADNVICKVVTRVGNLASWEQILAAMPQVAPRPAAPAPVEPRRVEQQQQQQQQQQQPVPQPREVAAPTARLPRVEGSMNGMTQPSAAYWSPPAYVSAQAPAQSPFRMLNPSTGCALNQHQTCGSSSAPMPMGEARPAVPLPLPPAVDSTLAYPHLPQRFASQQHLPPSQPHVQNMQNVQHTQQLQHAPPAVALPPYYAVPNNYAMMVQQPPQQVQQHHHHHQQQQQQMVQAPVPSLQHSAVAAGCGGCGSNMSPCACQSAPVSPDRQDSEGEFGEGMNGGSENCMPTFECPCAHNKWDSVRIKRKWCLLRCRVCEAHWRLPASDIPARRCTAFVTETCTDSSCPALHIYLRKQRLNERLRRPAAQPAAPFASGPPSQPMPMAC